MDKNRDLVCVDNSCAKGEYHLLSLTVWAPLKSLNITQGVVRLPESAPLNMELRIYANIVSVEGVDDSVFNGDEHKLNKGHWRDIRKTTSDERGKPFTVKKGSLIHLPVICKNKKVLLYVENREVIDDDINKENAN